MVILIEGAKERERWSGALLDEALKEAFFEAKEALGLRGGLKEISKRLAMLSLWSDREVYQRALQLKKLQNIED
jgi:hypothetical protein